MKKNDCNKTCKDCKFYVKYEDDEYIMKCTHPAMIFGKYDKIDICSNFYHKNNDPKKKLRFEHQWEKDIVYKISNYDNKTLTEEVMSNLYFAKSDGTFLIKEGIFELKMLLNEFSKRLIKNNFINNEIQIKL